MTPAENVFVGFIFCTQLLALIIGCAGGYMGWSDPSAPMKVKEQEDFGGGMPVRENAVKLSAGFIPKPAGAIEEMKEAEMALTSSQAQGLSLSRSTTIVEEEGSSSASAAGDDTPGIRESR